MVNISKRPLAPNVKKRIDVQFVNLFAQQRSKQDVATLFNELLTDSERIMLIKRLAVIVMFARGYSSYEIHKSLNISADTAARIRLNYINGKFPLIDKILGSKNNRFEKDWNDLIELIVYIGMPPVDRTGRRRWVEKMRES